MAAYRLVAVRKGSLLAAWLNACLLEYTLRCGSPFIAVAIGLAIRIETAVDIEEVSDLRKLVFRQL
jgi:hypothetical protein